MSSGDEAMLLDEMHVDGVGELRAVEQFTLADGRIVRVRQIHDTAPTRAAAWGGPNSGATVAASVRLAIGGARALRGQGHLVAGR